MKKIGILVPSTNLTVEYEIQNLFNQNIFNASEKTIYISKLSYKTSYKKDKIKFLNEISADEKNKMKELEYLGIKDILSFCTSASIINNKMINNPADAIIMNAKNRKINKCLLITPYNDEIGAKVVDFLEENNIKVESYINLNLVDTKEYFCYGLYNLEKLILEKYTKEYGDVIISCTNLPTIHFINRIEKKIKCNVISSNSSMFEVIKRI